MIFRLAKEADFPEIMEMIREAQAALRRDQVPQWQNGYPTEEIIREDIRKGENYVCEENGRLVGTMVLSFAGESTYQTIYDGQWMTEGESYGVIHRLAVSEQRKRMGVAKFMLVQAFQKCQKRKVKSLRIDTHEKNRAMRSWLEKNQFHFCGKIFLASQGDPRVAYEQMISTENESK